MKIHPSLAQEEAPFVTDAEAKQLFDQIMALYPDPQPTLHAEDPFQILVAVMLSAQTTDVAVNAVTPKLLRLIRRLLTWLQRRLRRSLRSLAG